MLEIAEARGQPPPDWAADCPEILRGEDFYLRAFWDLHTERQLGAVVPGPIPWSAVVTYGSRFGLEPSMVDVLAEVVRELDGAYLTWAAERAEESRKEAAARYEDG